MEGGWRKKPSALFSLNGYFLTLVAPSRVRGLKPSKHESVTSQRIVEKLSSIVENALECLNTEPSLQRRCITLANGLNHLQDAVLDQAVQELNLTAGHMCPKHPPPLLADVSASQQDMSVR